MKRSFLLCILLSCAISLSGCGLSESNGLMDQAKNYIENGEYDKAMANLSKVIDEDESNTEARGMYYQAMKLKNANRYDQRQNYEQEIKELQDILNDNTGSAKIRSQAEEQLNKAQEAFENQKKAMKIRKENAKKTAEKNKDSYRSNSIYNSNTYNSNTYNSNSYNNGYTRKYNGNVQRNGTYNRTYRNNVYNRNQGYNQQQQQQQRINNGYNQQTQQKRVYNQGQGQSQGQGQGNQ